jgi:hypothetical protein
VPRCLRFCEQLSTKFVSQQQIGARTAAAAHASGPHGMTSAQQKTLSERAGRRVDRRDCSGRTRMKHPIAFRGVSSGSICVSPPHVLLVGMFLERSMTSSLRSFSPHLVRVLGRSINFYSDSMSERVIFCCLSLHYDQHFKRTNNVF